MTGPIDPVAEALEAAKRLGPLIVAHLEQACEACSKEAAQRELSFAHASATGLKTWIEAARDLHRLEAPADPVDSSKWTGRGR